ncbi:D-3-phosphoglycerate dehydrogenase, chloroplastic [Hordeum vulgare]|nr:D-3-phosphoglycerate dehydrogenase, chloroplastic [Hordeum vulgare]
MAQAMLLHVNPARRPRISRSVAIPSPEVGQTVFFLRNHAVTLSAADGVNASSPMAVGRALEAQLAVPAHSLRVTAHHPEHFFVIFTQPAYQVNAVRRGSIRVDGASFSIASWHEHDHASFDALRLHVRVLIEGVPTQFSSVDGAEEILGRRVRVDRLDSRTLERGHTKTFACWVWTNDVANIPTRHTLGVLPRGAGRVEEMEGFSPPDRRVAPPPATAEYEMLIHVDRVEDWAPPSPRSSHFGQSGIPSSGSDEDSTAFPAVSSAPWAMGVEDGQRPDRHPRLKRAPVASLGCRDLPRGGQGRDQDNEDNGGNGAGGHRSWKDVLLRRGRTAAQPVPAANSRQRSRSAKKPLLAPAAVDGLAADVHAAVEVVLAEPLAFDKEALDRTPGEALQLDTFSPTLSASASDFGQFSRATPSAARTLEVQLGAVTSRVCQLEIAAPSSAASTASLFRAPEPPLLDRPTSAPRRSVAPPKSRAISAPTRHIARQATAGSIVPVAKRASLRIVKELGLLGPREKMTAQVAKALLQRFKEPLTDNDIATIAKLTRLDGEALRVMARMAGSDGIAEEAIV